MQIIKPGHKARKLKVMKTWLKIAEAVTNGTTIADVAKQFINPRTGKPFTRAYIYYVLKQLEIKYSQEEIKHDA